MTPIELHTTWTEIADLIKENPGILIHDPNDRERGYFMNEEEETEWSMVIEQLGKTRALQKLPSDTGYAHFKLSDTFGFEDAISEVNQIEEAFRNAQEPRHYCMIEQNNHDGKCAILCLPNQMGCHDARQ